MTPRIFTVIPMLFLGVSMVADPAGVIGLLRSLMVVLQTLEWRLRGEAWLAPPEPVWEPVSTAVQWAFRAGGCAVCVCAAAMLAA